MTTMQDLWDEVRSVQSAAGRLAAQSHYTRPPRPLPRRMRPPEQRQNDPRLSPEARHAAFDELGRQQDYAASLPRMANAGAAQGEPDPVHTPLQRGVLDLGRMLGPGNAYDMATAGGWGDLAASTAFTALPFVGLRGVRGEPVRALTPEAPFPDFGAREPPQATLNTGALRRTEDREVAANNFFPVAEDMAGHDVRPVMEIRRRIRDMTPTEAEVPLSELQATQHSLMDDFTTAGRDGMPEVYRSPDGRLLIMDGHNRAARAAANGERTIRVRLFDGQHPPDAGGWQGAFHGTGADIRGEIRPSEEGALGPGIYVSREPDGANFWARQKAWADDGDNVMPLEVRGPFMSEGEYTESVKAQVRQNGIDPERATAEQWTQAQARGRALTKARRGHLKNGAT